jgi:hypothetical protein
LIDKAMRQAREAGPPTPSSSSGLEDAGLLGAGAAGIAQSVKDATSAGTFAYRSTRSAAATLQVFIDALQALGDRDTRPQVSRRGTLESGQATVQFQQLLPTGNWVAAQTVTLIQSGDTVTVTVSAPSLAAMGGAAGDIGGTALGALGKVLTGNVIGGITDAARNVGRLTESAENIALSSNLRAAVKRIGEALDDEWRQADRERQEREERERIQNTCQFCGTPYPTADAINCAVCGAPRSQGRPAAE